MSRLDKLVQAHEYYHKDEPDECHQWDMCMKLDICVMEATELEDNLCFDCKNCPCTGELDLTFLD